MINRPYRRLSAPPLTAKNQQEPASPVRDAPRSIGSPATHAAASVSPVPSRSSSCQVRNLRRRNIRYARAAKTRAPRIWRPLGGYVRLCPSGRSAVCGQPRIGTSERYRSDHESLVCVRVFPEALLAQRRTSTRQIRTFVCAAPANTYARFANWAH
jgi:hypothetical protein